MRHIIVRLVIALIWSVMAVICMVKGNMSMVLVYGAVAAAFGYNAFTSYKKMKENNEK